MAKIFEGRDILDLLALDIELHMRGLEVSLFWAHLTAHVWQPDKDWTQDVGYPKESGAHSEDKPPEGVPLEKRPRPHDVDIQSVAAYQNGDKEIDHSWEQDKEPQHY